MKQQRPLSPHLQAYRLPLTGIISITHRMTGVALSAGLIFVVYLLVVVAGGEAGYLALQTTMNSVLFRLLYLLFVYALSFHLCHGVRHLIWDAGASFQRDSLTKFALAELIASVLLTLLILSFF